METYTTTQEQRLSAAQKQVKRIKGFYTHLTVYVLVNLFIIAGNIWDAPTHWFGYDSFATAIFWGIGLAVHGISVFGIGKNFGSDWEERKINELMNK